jgi:hypothetical protein
MQDIQKINALSFDELMKLTLQEIYKSLNSYREMIRSPKLIQDDIAESAINDYFFEISDPIIEDEKRLNDKLSEVK